MNEMEMLRAAKVFADIAEEAEPMLNPGPSETSHEWHAKFREAAQAYRRAAGLPERQ